MEKSQHYLLPQDIQRAKSNDAVFYKWDKLPTSKKDYGEEKRKVILHVAFNLNFLEPYEI